MLSIIMLIMPFLPFGSLPLAVMLTKDTLDQLPVRDDYGCEDVSNKTWTSQQLGSFSRDRHNNCPWPLLNYQCCCRPNIPAKIPIQFIVDNGKKKATASSQFFDPRLIHAIVRHERPVVWLVLGMLADDFITDQSIILTEEYVKLGFTVVYVDWDEMDKDFGQSVADSRVVAAMVGHMMMTSGVTERSLCVGASFGAQICGMAGKYLQRHGHRLPRCHLLDPAGVGFDGSRKENRVALSDCEVMVSIHTTSFAFTSYPVSMIHAPGFGTKNHNEANCNFIVNDGDAASQSGCFDLRNKSFMLRRMNRHSFRERGPAAQRCSHARAIGLYVSSLRQDCHRPLYGTDNSTQETITFPPYDECDDTMRRRLNVRTENPIKPFC